MSSSEQKIVSYVVAGAGITTPVSGAMYVTPADGATMRLSDVMAAWPFEGRFHFRRRAVPAAAGSAYACVWVDLLRASDAIPDAAASLRVLRLPDGGSGCGGDVGAGCPVEVYERWVAAARPLPRAAGAALEAPPPVLAAASTAGAGAAGGRGGGGRAPSPSQPRAAAPASTSSSVAAAAVGYGVAVGTAAFGMLGKMIGGVAAVVSRAAGMDDGADVGVPPSGAALNNLECLQVDLATPVCPGDAQHEALLEALWTCLYAGEEVVRVSPAWKRMGFQREDPVTDFRGGGVLALRCLVYFAKNYTRQVRAPRHARACAHTH